MSCICFCLLENIFKIFLKCLMWPICCLKLYYLISAAAAAAAKSLQLCLTVRPHRQQPTRLLRPWESPGKNTGVGCLFLLQCIEVKSESEVAQSCLTLSDPMNCSLPGSSVHGVFQARVLEWFAIAFSDLTSIWNFSRYIYLTDHQFNFFVVWEHTFVWFLFS